MLFLYKEKIAQWNWFDEECVSSTNDSIKEIPLEQHPAVISAVKQTKGRGRRGRKWYGKDGNLYMTFSLDIPPFELSRYVCLIGLSLAKTIKSLNNDVVVQIKWPNDIFLAHKKVTGMLLENIKNDLWAIGIGVNIIQFPKLNGQIYHATSLKEQGIIIERTEFLRLFLKNLDKDIQCYKKQGFEAVRKSWLEYAMYLNQEITVQNGTSILKGIFLTLDENGYLILKTNHGTERIIAGDLFK